jgi:hypothetical protein
LRLVNAVDQNLRINVDSGATTVDSALAYAAADPNFGVNPVVTEVAYINNDNDPVTGTSSTTSTQAYPFSPPRRTRTGEC